jgi:repressor of nif and glnA expression
MNQEPEKTFVAILRILADARAPMGARRIAEALVDYGIELTERTVRYHLKIMDERGLTEGHDTSGRTISDKGLRELENALVVDKVGLVITRIDTLCYRTTFDLDRLRGDVILNVSSFPEQDFRRALEAMAPVFRKGFSMGRLVAVARGGESLAGMEVEPGDVAFGTVCSVTANAVLFKSGIPVASEFGGLLEIAEGEPLRYTDLVTYAGSSVDPLEIFIKGGMTSVGSAARTGRGKIGAGFRTMPAAARQQVVETLERLRGARLCGLAVVGKPGRPVAEIDVAAQRVGMAIAGGLNPLAAAEEEGIPTKNWAMSTVCDFADLVPFDDLL